MIDLLTRALLHPRDYAPALRRHTIFLKDHLQLVDDIHTFVFQFSHPFSWQAGQHAIFTLPEAHVRGKTWRPFSVASSPHEGVIKMSTVITAQPSDFKKKLLGLRYDDPVHVYGPYGEFHAHRNIKHIIGIAGGIGITPFRALAYEIAHRHLPETRLTLIYAARNTYPYKPEFDRWQNKYFRIHYVHTADEVQQALKTQYDLHGNKADYFVSGSPTMITATNAYAKTLGVTHMTSDPFKGYA